MEYKEQFFFVILGLYSYQSPELNDSLAIAQGIGYDTYTGATEAAKQYLDINLSKFRIEQPEAPVYIKVDKYLLVRD